MLMEKFCAASNKLGSVLILKRSFVSINEKPVLENARKTSMGGCLLENQEWGRIMLATGAMEQNRYMVQAHLDI